MFFYLLYVFILFSLYASAMNLYYSMLLFILLQLVDTITFHTFYDAYCMDKLI